jgi:6-phosphofructokinase 1
MMAFVREEGESYSCRVEAKEIATIANAVRCVPEAYLTEEKNHINEAGLDYLFPLIQGEVDLVYENGLPKHITLK